jgi:predicted TIM-barrel fold metal-dependent hydrolase
VLDGIPLVDAHLHTPRLSTLKDAWKDWAAQYGRQVPLSELYDGEGVLIPERFDAYLEREGVDHALLLCEYSPKATGIQPIEDLLLLAQYNPARIHLVANLNPHYHYPMVAELERQRALGALALKLHPVHGGFSPNDRSLYSVYAHCERQGVPVIFHSGTSVFPGSTNSYADPALVEDVARDFPDLSIVLAHGGRGWWYEAAAFLTLMRPNVWIEISGLPPQRLPDYYKDAGFERVARKMIFGTDWPGVPGIAANARVLQNLGLDRETLEAIYYKNAMRVYRLGRS